MSSDNKALSSLGSKAFAIGVIGIIVAAVGLIQGVSGDDQRPVFSWLIGISFWLSILIGFLFLTMIWYVFDAGWGTIIRRQLEHAMAGFKYILILFLPLLAIAWGYWGNDPGILWKWMNPAKEALHGTIAEDALYIHKESYLNVKAFTIRFGLYFLTWIGLAYIMRKSSYTMDRDGDIKWAHLPRKASTVGLFCCAFATTFAAIDWFMSIEYHWFSTMYGVWFFAESMRTCLAVIIITIFLLSNKGYLKGLITEHHYYFTGCIMLAFTLFWAYVSFSQYFLIYNANIPEETFWYNLRELTLEGEKSSWWWVSMFLIFGQFFVPFFCLLSYKLKTTPKLIFRLAIWMVFCHMVDIYWNILPGKVIDGQAKYGYILREFDIISIYGVYDIAMVIGVGGIMIWSWTREAIREKPIPIRDPRIMESVNASQ